MWLTGVLSTRKLEIYWILGIELSIRYTYQNYFFRHWELIDLLEETTADIVFQPLDAVL